VHAALARTYGHRVQARELAEPFPTVRADTDALVATRMLADRGLPGLVVLDSGAGRWSSSRRRRC
jgi:hypothetical protein